MPPVPQTPPAESLGSQFSPANRNSQEVDPGQTPTLLSGNEDARPGKEEPPIRVSSSSLAKMKQKTKPVDTSRILSEAFPYDPSPFADPPPVPPGYVAVPYKSPSPSVFGNDDSEEYGFAAEPPENIRRYLDDHNWEVHYVVPDGNCLYRALTYGPESTRHGHARDSTGAILDGIKQPGNILGTMVTKDEIEEIRTGLAIYIWSETFVRQVMAE